MSDETETTDRPDYNQALPSIGTWKAPWEDNPNKPFPVASPLDQLRDSGQMPEEQPQE